MLEFDLMQMYDMAEGINNIYHNMPFNWIRFLIDVAIGCFLTCLNFIYIGLIYNNPLNLL